MNLQPTLPNIRQPPQLWQLQAAHMRKGGSRTQKSGSHIRRQMPWIENSAPSTRAAARAAISEQHRSTSRNRGNSSVGFSSAGAFDDAAAVSVGSVFDGIDTNTQNRQQTVLLEALARLRKKDKKQIFASEVDGRLVPDYYTVISKPMSFDSIKKKIMRMSYFDFSEFDSDVALIISNCRLYNKPDTPFCREATLVEVCWGKLRDRFRQKFDHAVVADQQAAAAATTAAPGADAASLSLTSAGEEKQKNNLRRTPTAAQISTSEQREHTGPSSPKAVSEPIGSYDEECNDVQPGRTFLEEMVLLFRMAADTAAAEALRGTNQSETSQGGLSPGAATAHEYPSAISNTAQSNPFFWAEYWIENSEVEPTPSASYLQSYAPPGPAYLDYSGYPTLKDAEECKDRKDRRGDGTAGEMQGSLNLKKCSEDSTVASAVGVDCSSPQNKKKKLKIVDTRKKTHSGKRQISYFKSLCSFLGENAMKKLRKDFPSMYSAISSFDGWELPLYPLSDLRILGFDTCDFGEFNSKLQINPSYLLGVGETHILSACSLNKNQPVTASPAVGGASHKRLQGNENTMVTQGQRFRRGICTDVLLRLVGSYRNRNRQADGLQNQTGDSRQHIPAGSASSQPLQHGDERTGVSTSMSSTAGNPPVGGSAEFNSDLGMTPQCPVSASLGQEYIKANPILTDAKAHPSSPTAKSSGGSRIRVAPNHFEMLFDILTAQKNGQLTNTNVFSMHAQPQSEAHDQCVGGMNMQQQVTSAPQRSESVIQQTGDSASSARQQHLQSMQKPAQHQVAFRQHITPQVGSQFVSGIASVGGNVQRDFLLQKWVRPPNTAVLGTFHAPIGGVEQLQHTSKDHLKQELLLQQQLLFQQGAQRPIKGEDRQQLQMDMQTLQNSASTAVRPETQSI